MTPVFKRMEVSVYGKKAIKREIYQIIIPMILENILQISANLVITAMVGRLLANDISAQGICIRITDTLWCFYKGVAIGATVLIARAYGAGLLDQVTAVRCCINQYVVRLCLHAALDNCL